MVDQFFSRRVSRGACRGRRSQVRAGQGNREVRADLPAGIMQTEFRSRMERAFGECFADVVIRRSHAVDAHFGGVAATVDQNILIGDGFFSLTPPRREIVLAHELAHVVQKRRPAPASAGALLSPRYRARLEAEAHLAAVEAIRGGRPACRLPDVPGIPSAWGPAGHYWTCYFVMLAAGVKEDEAQKRAFFCQMPDQVREFDASCAGIDWAELDLGIPRGSPLWGQFPSTDPQSVPTHVVTHVTHARSRFTDFEEYTTTTQYIEPVPQTLKAEMEQRQLDLDISEGLHSLTGGNASGEVMYRELQLVLHSDDPLAYGLALHAYGDSYAHQDMSDSELMYAPIVGHSIGLLRPGEAKDTTGSYFGRAMDNAHEPDDISNPKPGRSSLYHFYVRNLYRIVCSTLGNKPRISQAAVLDALKKLTDMKFVEMVNGFDDDHKQIIKSSAVRGAIRDSLKIAPAPYQPETEPGDYWRRFWPNHSAIITNANKRGAQEVFDQVREIGHQWRRESEQRVALERSPDPAAGLGGFGSPMKLKY